MVNRNRHNDDGNGWSEYRRLVMNELERLNEVMEHLREDVQKVDDNVMSLKMKASMWGAAAGTIVAGFLQLIPFLVNRIMGKQ
jgi:hypothetical protein